VGLSLRYFKLQANPELIEAAIHDPARFATLLRQVRQQYETAEAQKRRQTEVLNADPFDIDAQQRIEEAIRQEAIMENLNHAMEYSPESFGKVIML
jgi:restriction endonuclease Mrr